MALDSVLLYYAHIYLIRPWICEINILSWLFGYSRNFHRFHNCYSKYFRNNAPNLIKRQHLFRKLPKGNFNLWGGPKSGDDFGNRALETSYSYVQRGRDLRKVRVRDRVGQNLENKLHRENSYSNFYETSLRFVRHLSRWFVERYKEKFVKQNVDNGGQEVANSLSVKLTFSAWHPR